jgi:hypothetical protein
VFVAYTPAGGVYTVDVPQGWAKAAAPATTTFSDHFNSATITVGAAAAAPTDASARSATTTAYRSSAGFHLVKVDSVDRSSGMAVHVVYDLKSAADPVTGKSVTLEDERYEFWRSGKLVTITLASPKGSDNVDPWKRITDSFSWK